MPDRLQFAVGTELKADARIVGEFQRLRHGRFEYGTNRENRKATRLGVTLAVWIRRGFMGLGETLTGF